MAKQSPPPLFYGGGRAGVMEKKGNGETASAAGFHSPFLIPHSTIPAA